MLKTDRERKEKRRIQLGRTFGSVGCLVILGKPLQILVLHPRHPGFVLLVVVFLHPLRARL